MRTNLALANIRSSLTRTIISVAGIGVAVVLIFMQLGFRGAVESTATTIYGKLDFDLAIRSKDYLHFVDSRQIPRSILTRLRPVPGIKSADPFFVSMGNWLHPEGERIRGIIIMGTPFNATPFKDEELVKKIPKLSSDRFILIDRKTHREFGPVDGKHFSEKDIGVVTNVNQRSITIVGTFSVGAGLTANGSLITSERGFGRLVPIDTNNFTSMILVKLKPGTDRLETVDSLKKLLVADDHATILTRDEVIQAELTRWIDQTPLGFVFTLGVIVSFIVGSAIVFMVLSNDVSNRLPEYATLKAMGFTNFYLSTIVLKQATYLAIFAFIPALILSLGLYAFTSFLANINIQMTLLRVVAVLVISVLMCWMSGFGALKKLWQAEPASLF